MTQLASHAAAEAIARALLYEGYLLYPYRASSLKNRHRFLFGCLYPPAWCARRETGDASAMQTEVLVVGDAAIDADLRFLHLTARREGASDWQEALERDVAVHARIPALVEAPRTVPFHFDADRAGARDAIEGTVTLVATRVASEVHRLRITVDNTTPTESPSPTAHDDAIARAFVSTHVRIGVTGGELVSLLDPPDALRAAAEGCKNVGAWPVLVGSEGDRSSMIASPVILYDYPRVAPESAGDLFDGTEIDEILTLRILTLTDDEKRAMRAVDPRAAALLDRTEALDHEARLRLHGAVRSLGRSPTTARGLKPGDRVRLHPRERADVFDIALRGMVATIASIEQDYEGRVFFAVTVDEDPGRDLGAEGKPGHRFFFRPEEVEGL